MAQVLFSNKCLDHKKTLVWLALICRTDDVIDFLTLGNVTE